MRTFIFLILLFSSCKDNPIIGEKFDSLGVYNNSAGIISIYVADTRALTQYPDTSLPLDEVHLISIKPNERFGYTISGRFWKEEFRLLPSDTLSIFIFDAKIYRDSAWSYIRDNYQILKRYDLSYENLEHLDFQVPYPPNEWMTEHVKMYR